MCAYIYIYIHTYVCNIYIYIYIYIYMYMGSRQAGLFVFFILTRALHPLLIDASKTDGKTLDIDVC